MNEVSHVKSVSGEVLDDEISPRLAEMAQQISTEWRKAAESIIQTGRMLLEAEAQLSAIEWRDLQSYLATRGGMSKSTVSKLRRIASNPVLTNPDHMMTLPPSYATLYELAQVDEADLTRAFAEKQITPDIERKDIPALFPRPKAPAPAKNAKENSSTAQTFVIKISVEYGDIPTDLKTRLKSVVESISNLENVSVEFEGGSK